MENAFREGGQSAWWRGLQLRIWQLQLSRKTAKTEQERRECEAELQEAERLRDEARRHGDHWLF
jgi:hypothetical protein